MRSQRQSGSRKMEILAFIIIAGLGAMIFLYFQQKPQVMPGPGAIQAPPPTPPPAATEPAPVVVEAPPPPPPPKAAEVVVEAPPPPPPTPECVLIQQKLNDAQISLARAAFDLEAAKKAAVVKLRKSDDYINATSDLNDKQKAREDAVSQLAKDTSTGSDTDQDQTNIRAAAQAIIDAKNKIASLESDAAANDPATNQKQVAFDSTKASLGNLQKQLNDSIAKMIADNSASANCAIESVTLDPKTWTIEAKLAPDSQKDAGAVTDAAVVQIGSILDKTLYHAPFTWNTAKFTVYVDLQNKKVPEFQAAYLRDAVDQTSFKLPDGRHYDDQMVINLAHSIWLSRAVETIQGIKPSPPVIVAAVAGSRPMYKYTSSLLVGGYARTDGTFCPATYVRQSWQEAVPATPPTVNRTPNMQDTPLFSDTDPFNLPPGYRP